MEGKYYDQYSRTLRGIKEITIKKLIGTSDIKGIQEILDLKNYYNINITNDENLSKSLEIIENILNTNDINDIVQLNKSLNEENTKVFKEIVKDLKPEAFYKQAHVDSITDFNSMDKNELSEKSGIEVSSKDGVNIYKLQGIPFNLMVHVGDYNSPNNVRGTDTVHTSMLNSDKSLDTIGGGQKKKLLVFNNITSENINYMTTRDAWTLSNDKDRIEETKMLPEEFKANCANTYNDYQLKTENGKLQPNAICVMGEISDEDIEYAKNRGINAIYSIDEEIYKNKDVKNKDEFNQILSQYKESFNPALLAKLKNINPYNRDEFISIIQNTILSEKNAENIDAKLLNINIDEFKKIFRRELKDASSVHSKDGDKLLEEFVNIEKLKENETIIGLEEKSIENFGKIYSLQNILNNSSTYMSSNVGQQAVEDCIRKSSRFT